MWRITGARPGGAKDVESHQTDGLIVAPIELPSPRLAGGLSLSSAFEQRRTTRQISTARLPIELLSNLLWAACGMNRPTGPFGLPGRTAASASNSQEIDTFVALEEGVYRYEAPEHRLAPVVAGDWRAAAMTPGQQGVEATAPVQLIYVADIRRLNHTAGFEEPGLHDPEVQKSYYFVDTGMIAGNVHLYAAAQGLAAWFHNCDKGKLATRLRLHAEQRVLFAQSVGYPDPA
jgi:nitroreductase